MAVETSPLAVVANPFSVEKGPMFASSHCAASTAPARKAALEGCHIRRLPGPSVGIGPDGPLAKKPPSRATGPAAKPPLPLRCTSVFGVFSLVPPAAAGGLGSHMDAIALNVKTLPSTGAAPETGWP